jgi:hypothetical protein
VGPVASFAIIALMFTGGIVASVIADRRDPDSERKREERAEQAKGAADVEGEAEPAGQAK